MTLALYRVESFAKLVLWVEVEFWVEKCWRSVMMQCERPFIFKIVIAIFKYIMLKHFYNN